MSLASHVDVDQVLEAVRKHPHDARRKGHSLSALEHTTPYSSRYASTQEISKFRLPEKGAPADTVHQLIKDELDLDGRPQLNLASFVGTYMEDHGTQLMVENISKNMSDADEYPAMMDLHARSISILANLWGAQKGEKAIGTATTGSSEGIFLGALAMKRRWQEKRRAEGKDTHSPNIIMGANAQVALEKAQRYLDLEGRILPVSEASQYRLDPELVRKNIDSNTVGIFVILGSTYTGHYEPVEEISNVLDEYEKATGINISIHVDAASGGFVAPFTDAKVGGPKWDFELPRVCSINSSAHKFGLVYVGVGIVIFRDEKMLPEYLQFQLSYLGGTESTYTLNFSRPGAQIIGLYFNLIHLGREGYKAIMENCLSNARTLSKALEASGRFICVSNIHRKKGTYSFEAVKSAVSGTESNSSGYYNPGLPVVAFRFSDKFKAEFPDVKQESVSTLLRAKNWIVPNYPLPPNEEKTEILRVVVRESFSLDLIDRLLADLFSISEILMSSDPVDLAGFAGGSTSFEKQNQSQGKTRAEAQNSEHPMSEGIHKAVC